MHRTRKEIRNFLCMKPVDNCLGPILMMVLPKFLKFHFISQYIHISISYQLLCPTLFWQHTQKRAAVANSTRTEIRNFIEIRPLDNFWAPNWIQNLSKTPPWWYFYQKVNFIHCYLKKCFLEQRNLTCFWFVSSTQN